MGRGPPPAGPNAYFEVSSPPAIYRDLLIIGFAPGRTSWGAGPAGDVRAYDVRSWRPRVASSTPCPGRASAATRPGRAKAGKTGRGANVWSVMSVDTERGLVFLPVGSATYDFYGGDRKGG